MGELVSQPRIQVRPINNALCHNARFPCTRLAFSSVGLRPMMDPGRVPHKQRMRGSSKPDVAGSDLKRSPRCESDLDGLLQRWVHQSRRREVERGEG